MAESMAVNAARWVVDKVLSPLSGGFLKAWAASSGLGRNVGELNTKLLSARAMLDNARGRQIDNPDLTKLLQKLRDLAYDAEDVLDELDYFRIQDELDGTYEAADKHPKGCLHDLALNATKFLPCQSPTRAVKRSWEGRASSLLVYATPSKLSVNTSPATPFQSFKTMVLPSCRVQPCQDMGGVQSAA